METLKLASFNVNVINVPAKRRIIFDKIRKSKAQIAFIQETHSSEATAFLWESEWGGKSIFNHGVQNSRGVAILFARNFTPKVIKEQRDDNGRILAIDLSWGDDIFTLGCLYAPTQDKPLQQAQFMNDLERTLDALTSDNLILGGDFNCILDPIMDRNSTCILPASSKNYRSRLRTFMEERQLCDIMRVRNPTKRFYTFRRNNYASRLDLLLVSDQLSESMSQVKSFEGPHSDHTLISAMLCRSEYRMGPGYWRFDSSLLTQEAFTQAMNSFLTEWQPPEDLPNPNSRWEWLKFEIGNFIREYVREKRARDARFLSGLQTELEDLYSSIDRGRYLGPAGTPGIL